MIRSKQNFERIADAFQGVNPEAREVDSNFVE